MTGDATVDAPLAEGAAAPEFTLPDQHGASVSLRQLCDAGPVAVIFFPYAHTSICTSELRAIAERLGEFDSFGVTPVAISCDSMFTLRVLSDSEGLDFRLLSDFWPHGRVASEYGVFDAERGCALRGSFLVDQGGTVRWRVVNPLPDPRSLSELCAQLGSLGGSSGGEGSAGTG